MLLAGGFCLPGSGAARIEMHATSRAASQPIPFWRLVPFPPPDWGSDHGSLGLGFGCKVGDWLWCGPWGREWGR